MLEYLKARPLALLIGMFLAFEVLAFEAITSNAIMVDEFAHLPAGVAYWRDGLFSMYDENPPLLRVRKVMHAEVGGPRHGTSSEGTPDPH
jgi:hypothetical protein